MALFRPALVLSTLVLVAWSASLAGPPPGPSPAATSPVHGEDKPRPPVSLTLEAEDAGDEVVARLTVQARHPVAGAVARLVPPEGTSLAAGTPEVPLEALEQGDIRQVSWRLGRVASGPLRLAAGIDVRVAPGILLHRSVVAEVMAARPQAQAQVTRVLDGPRGGVRVYSARR